MQGTFSSVCPDPSFKLIPLSIPYCVYRNKLRYQYGIEYSTGIDPFNPSFNYHTKAAAQTLLSFDNLLAPCVPTQFVYGSIRRELGFSHNLRPLCNTVAVLHHEDLDLFAHTSGEHLDEIILRDSMYTFKGRDLDQPPGFTLSLGKGSNIQQIGVAGTTHWGSKSQLLARNNSELYHIRTAGLDHYISPSNGVCPDDIASSTKSLRQCYEEAPVILEPVSKWALPRNICSMSCTDSGIAALLSTEGTLFTWTSVDGLCPFQSGKSVFRRGGGEYQMRHVEVGAHSRVLYLTNRQSVYSLDLRSQSTASRMHDSGTSAGTGPILSMKQHGTEANLLMISTKDSAQLIDTRFSRAPISTQFVPRGHSCMSFTSSSIPCSNSGVFVGAAQGGDQLFIHSLQKDNHYDNFNCSDNGWFGWGKIGEGGRGAELLLATHQRNFKGGLRWDVDGFPLVDSGENESLSSAALMGFGLSCIRNTNVYSPDKSSKDDFDSDSDNENDDWETTIGLRLQQKHHTGRDFDLGGQQQRAVLLQQNSRGDVFVQRLMWTYNPYLYSQAVNYSSSKGIKMSTPSHGGVNRSNLQKLATHRKKKPLKRRRPAHRRDDSEEESSEEDEDESDEVQVDSNQNDTSLRGTIFGNDRSESGKNVVVDNLNSTHIDQGASFRISPPPVQLCLPCGVRAFTNSIFFRRNGQEREVRERTSMLRSRMAIKRFLHTILRNNGLILLNAISTQSDGIAVESGGNEKGIVPEGVAEVKYFPSPAAAFPFYIPEDCMRGFDLLRLRPEDLVQQKQPLKQELNDTSSKQPNTSSPLFSKMGDHKALSLIERFHQPCLEFLRQHPRTLWEIWKHAVELFGCNNQLALRQLRVALNGEYGLIEHKIQTFLPTTDAHTSSAGNTVSTPKTYRIHHHEDQRSESENSSEENHYSSDELDEISNREDGSYQPTSIGTEYARSFDGMYGVEVSACTLGGSLGYFRDTSMRREIRMSRILPPKCITASAEQAGGVTGVTVRKKARLMTEFAKKHSRSSRKSHDEDEIDEESDDHENDDVGLYHKSNKNVVKSLPQESFDGFKSHCNCRWQNGISQEISLCDSGNCLSPHLLVYCLPSVAASRINSANNKKAAMAKSTTAVELKKQKNQESFYWGVIGDQHAVPEYGVSVNASQQCQTPAPAPSQSQLSQLMFGTQTQSQSQIQPDTHINALPQLQTQSHGKLRSQPDVTNDVECDKAIGESENDQQLDLDVTDNMLAVLNNNWNRLAGNTPFVDVTAHSIIRQPGL